MRLPEWGKVSVLQQGESFQNMSDVRRDADRPPPNLRGNIGLLLIDTGIGSAPVLQGHLPEGILDDARGVMFIAHHFFGDHLRLMFWQHSGLHK